MLGTAGFAILHCSISFLICRDLRTGTIIPSVHDIVAHTYSNFISVKGNVAVRFADRLSVHSVLDLPVSLV